MDVSTTQWSWRGPLDDAEMDLPVAPYTFGCWLGDGRTGGACITSADQEILDLIRADGYTVTHHHSTKLQPTIWNTAERARRIAPPGGLAGTGHERLLGCSGARRCRSPRPCAEGGRRPIPPRPQGDFHACLSPGERYRSMSEIFRKMGTS